MFAYSFPEISYCQGMNFLMGFLYLCFQEEETTFNAFNKIINLLLSEIFSSDLRLVLLKFYQLDRLIAFALPKLAIHFKVI